MGAPAPTKFSPGGHRPHDQRSSDRVSSRERAKLRVRPRPYTRAFHASGRTTRGLTRDEEAKRNHRRRNQRRTGGSCPPPPPPPHNFLASTHVCIIHVYSHELLSLSAPPKFNSFLRHCFAIRKVLQRRSKGNVMCSFNYPYSTLYQ